MKSWKAQPMGDEPVRDLVIEFVQEVPDFWDAVTSEPPHLASARAYRKEADRIVDALWVHLPGGLCDALFASMCSLKASVLRVPGKSR